MPYLGQNVLNHLPLLILNDKAELNFVNQTKLSCPVKYSSHSALGRGTIKSFPPQKYVTAMLLLSTVGY